MVNYISGLVFVLWLLVGAAGFYQFYPFWQTGGTMVTGGGAAVTWLIVGAIVSSAIQLAAQWERAVVFRLGRFKDMRGPGLFWIIPLIDQLRMVDTRVRALDIPRQQVITRDNVPVSINGVLFFRVNNAADAIVHVQDYTFAISQYAQTALRDVIGQMTLDELLAEREQIGRAIEQTVEKETKGWGLDVTGIRIQDVDMPEELKKMMSRQASAEREKRATITKAEGDKMAALNLAEAARTMAQSPGAMQLRTLQTIDGLGPTSSNTVVLAVPVEIMEAVLALRSNHRASSNSGETVTTKSSGSVSQ